MDLLSAIFTEEVIAYLVQLVAMVVFTGLGMLTKLAYGYIKQKMGVEKMDAFMTQVEVTVAFLEQFGVNLGLDNGMLKKEYAVNFLMSKATDMGVKTTTAEVGMLVEAYVNAVTS
jgi:hypothetical protein